MWWDHDHHHHFHHLEFHRESSCYWKKQTLTLLRWFDLSSAACKTFSESEINYKWGSDISRLNRRMKWGNNQPKLHENQDLKIPSNFQETRPECPHLSSAFHRQPLFSPSVNIPKIILFFLRFFLHHHHQLQQILHWHWQKFFCLNVFNSCASLS